MRVAGPRSRRTVRSAIAARARRMGIVPLLVLLLPLVTPAAAETIPPGQEAVLAAMLGRGEALPGGCTFGEGQIDREVVHATYRCPYGTVRLDLQSRTTAFPSAITTERFALTVTEGSPRDDLLAALAARVRSREAELETDTRVVDAKRGTAAPLVALRWSSALVLLALAGWSALGGTRAGAIRAPLATRTLVESVVVALVVVLWLQLDGAPPAHQDTAVDVALGRDCLASSGAFCLGHAASAIGLVQGQAFTYALAAWLFFGWSMRALAFVAASGLGAATGLLHYVIARRFGRAAWLSSAAAAVLAVAMSGYPTIWNPSWFVLPLTIAFVALLALARGGGHASAFVAGLAFAFTAESHLLFGTFVAVAIVIVLLTARDAWSAAGVMATTFVATELVVSPTSLAQNARILHEWIGTHPVPVVATVLLFCASIPSRRRLRRRLGDDPDRREGAMVLAWLLASVVALGLVLPWAVARPLQARYFGGAFPAIGYALARLLAAPAARTRPAIVRVAALAATAGLVWSRATTPTLGSTGWLMDDGRAIATSSGRIETSALEMQLAIRPIPGGRLAPAAASFAGTTDAPPLSDHILRAVLATPGAAAPPGWQRLRAGRADILTSDIEAWTRPTEARVCPEPPTGDSCVTLTPEDFRDLSRVAGGFVHRLFGFRIDRAAAPIAAWTAGGAHALLWTIPVRPTGADTAREIVIDDAMAEPIVAVDGTRWTKRARGHAVIARPAPGTQAAITIRTPIADKFEAGIPPLPFELREDERGILPTDETPPRAESHPHD